MSGSSEVVLVEDRESVRTLTLNRPQVLNAFDAALIAELNTAVRAAAEDETARCVVVTGAGRAFCSGQDLAEYAGRFESADPLELEPRLRDEYNPIIISLRTMAKPVLASVNGVAAGAGCSLALACDLRIAAESASFIEAFINIGLVPDCGSTLFLPRLVGAARAAEIAFSGRKVGAQEALEIGLVNKMVADSNLRDETAKLAQQLAHQPTRAVGWTKRALNAAWDNNLETQLELEAKLQTPATRTRDHREGIAAFMEKRRAEFQGR